MHTHIKCLVLFAITGLLTNPQSAGQHTPAELLIAAERSRTALSSWAEVRRRLELALQVTSAELRNSETRPEVDRQVADAVHAVIEYQHQGMEPLLLELSSHFATVSRSTSFGCLEAMRSLGTPRAVFEELIRRHEDDERVAGHAAILLGYTPTREYLAWLADDMHFSAAAQGKQSFLGDVLFLVGSAVFDRERYEREARLPERYAILKTIALDGFSFGSRTDWVVDEGGSPSVRWAQSEIANWAARAPEEFAAIAGADVDRSVAGVATGLEVLRKSCEREVACQLAYILEFAKEPTANALLRSRIEIPESCNRAAKRWSLE